MKLIILLFNMVVLAVALVGISFVITNDITNFVRSRAASEEALGRRWENALAAAAFYEATRREPLFPEVGNFGPLTKFSAAPTVSCGTRIVFSTSSTTITDNAFWTARSAEPITICDMTVESFQ